MATDQEAIPVKLEELYEPSEGGFAGAPAVQIDGLEEVKPSEVQKVDSKEEDTTESSTTKSSVSEDHSEPITHETDSVKTTYDTEDDSAKLSTKAKIKEKLTQLGDKLRPKDAVEAKNADPHPGLV